MGKTLVAYKGNRIDGRTEIPVEELAATFWKTHDPDAWALGREVVGWLADDETRDGMDLAIDWKDNAPTILDDLLDAIEAARPKEEIPNRLDGEEPNLDYLGAGGSVEAYRG